MHLRGASHHGWRSRDRRFPPIKLQETKSSASRPFTLWPKSKGRRNWKWILFEEGDGLSMEVWVGREWKLKLWSRGRRFFSLKNQSLTRSWPLDWRGYFEQGIKWDAPLSLNVELGLWKLHTIPRSKAPLTILYWLFSTHFFGFSTKFGHSIPRPLDLDGHSVKWP
jgi:hypothetical protein